MKGLAYGSATQSLYILVIGTLLVHVMYSVACCTYCLRGPSLCLMSGETNATINHMYVYIVW